MSNRDWAQLAIIALLTLLVGSFWFGVGFIVWHFVAKYW